MLADGEKIGQNLCRMRFVRQAVPYRDAGVLRQFFHDLLTEAAVFDTVKHTPQNFCGISDALLLSDLRARRIEICHTHAQIVAGHFKGASGARARLLKDQSDIFPPERVHRLAGFFLRFQLGSQIDEIGDLFRCKIFDFQKVFPF